MLSARLRAHCLPICLVLFPLLGLYLTTLQTIPNGSSHYFMIDAGETQIVLNEWGSLHITGYPLYVVSGNVLTTILRLIGISAIAAPAMVSLLWGLLSLLLLYRLGTQLGAPPLLAAGVSLLHGLTRTFWIHSVIAEIYSFNQLLLMILLCIALRRGQLRGRVYWLALAGGIALAHHRAFITLVPAFLYAVWPTLRASGRRLPRLLLTSLALGAVGMLPYLWPLLRAQAGAAWVYGEPSTIPGLFNVILGTEASRFIGPPTSLAALQHNIQLVNAVLIRDLSLPGVLLGLTGLLLALRTHRRPAITLLLCASGAWLFHLFFYSDILSALILPVSLSLAFGWLFAADALLQRFPGRRPAHGGMLLAAVVAALLLLRHNLTFIRQLTSDPSGLETVTALEAAPPGSTVMLAWGTRYFAASAAQLYLERLDHITLTDDNGELHPAFLDGTLVTPDYTFFNQPPPWWENRLGQKVWLDAAGPRLVRIMAAPNISNSDVAGPFVQDAQLHCEDERLVLQLVWNAGATAPFEDFSVFVKAFADDGSLLAQGDQFAHVYGLRPTSSWLAGEQLRDFYPLAASPQRVASLAYGLYRVTPAGEYENVLEYRADPVCAFA